MCKHGEIPYNTPQLDLWKHSGKRLWDCWKCHHPTHSAKLKLAVMFGITPDLTKGGEVNKLASSIQHWLILSSSRGWGLSVTLSVFNVCVLCFFIPLLINWHWDISSHSAKVSVKVVCLYRQTVVPSIKPIWQDHGKHLWGTAAFHCYEAWKLDHWTPTISLLFSHANSCENKHNID